MPHRHRHRGADADRREEHDQAGVLEHHVRQPLEEPEYDVLRPARCHLCQRDGEEHGEDHYLEHFVPRPRSKKLAGKVCSSTPARVTWLLANCSPWSAVAAVRSTPSPGRKVDGDEAERQRERRDELEVHDRPEGEATHALEVVTVTRDADDQAGEHERHHDRLDQPQEDRGEGLQFRGDIGAVHRV